MEFNYDDWLKGGKIAGQVREYAGEIVKPGARVLDIVNELESKIIELGGGIAFPANLSINERAAHDTAVDMDSRIITEDDVIKVDVGAHVNGCIGDTARTIVFKDEYKDLQMASKKALEEAIKILHPGTKLGEIGEAIESTIESLGFKPIRNLTGHGLRPYEVHTDPEILNFKTDSDYEFYDGQIIAIEPFATNGEGLVREINETNIYMFLRDVPTRVNHEREILNFAKVKNHKLPFSKRWLPRMVGRDLFLNKLVQMGGLYSFPVLSEVGNGLVSQFEHTIIVRDKPIVTTKVDEAMI